MNRLKAQGTKHESWCVALLRVAGFSSQRLAEGGSKDEGDFEVFFHGLRWVGEAKARQSLNIQDTLGKVRKKAGGSSPVLVVWKRLVRVEGKAYRQPVNGERVVVSLSIDDFILALDNAYIAGQLSTQPTTNDKEHEQ